MATDAKDDPVPAGERPARASVAPSTPVRSARYLEFIEQPPSEVSPSGNRTSLVRDQNAVIVWTQASPGTGSAS